MVHNVCNIKKTYEKILFTIKIIKKLYKNTQDSSKYHCFIYKIFI